MKLSRNALLPLLLAFCLLFAEQTGSAHMLSHALEKQSQHYQQTPNSNACEQCAGYAQLGNALSAGVYDFAPAPVPAEAIQHDSNTFRIIPSLAAAARGPPVSLRTYA